MLFEPPGSSAGVAVTEEAALSIAAVFAACFRLANIMAMLPLGVYEKGADGKRKELNSHPAVRPLTIESNPEQTAFAARHFMQFWKPLFGAAVAEIGWDGAGRPRMLWPLEPWRVQPKYDKSEQLYYEVDGTRRVSPRDLIYVPHVTADGVTGQGFVHYAVDSLGQSIAADRAAGRFFVNDMRPGGLLQHDGNPNEQQRKKMREEWGLAHGGVKNRGSVGVLWGGWKWVREAGIVEPDKAQLLDTRKWTVVEVARWLNVPPHWVADLGRATWANIESQSIEALIYSVMPLFVGTEQEIDRKLLDPPRVYCKHNANALLRGDMAARAEWYKAMREVGVFNSNDILALEDMNGIGPEGDRRFIPVNFQPLDDLMTGGAAAIKLAEAKAAATPAFNRPAPAKVGAEPPVKSGPSAELLSSLRAVAAHALTGFAKKETNEARRAAKNPKELFSWIDGFYPDFEKQMAAGLAATELLYRSLLPDGEGWATKLAAEWVAASKSALLSCSECQPHEWPNRSAALFASWEGRPNSVAERIHAED